MLEIDETLTTAPPPRASISGMACFIDRKQLLRLTAKTLSKSSSESSTTSPGTTMPTLLTSRSSPPNSATAASTAALTSSEEVALPPMPSAVPPSSRIVRAASSARRASRSKQTTLAPSRANCAAQALPMPQPPPAVPAPMTSAVFPLKRSTCLSPLFRLGACCELRGRAGIVNCGRRSRCLSPP